MTRFNHVLSGCARAGLAGPEGLGGPMRWMTRDLLGELRTVLERHTDVLVAYLFGSSVRGRAGPLSDVDVAVLLAADGDPSRRQIQLIGELAARSARIRSIWPVLLVPSRREPLPVGSRGPP